MSNTFSLWNLYQYNHTLKFDVTSGSLYGVYEGTEEWVEHCLQAFNVAATVESWHITPCRSYYYSDYPQDRPWKNRWVPTWIVHVQTQETFQSNTNKLFTEPQGTRFIDPTWQDKDIKDIDDIVKKTSLIVVDYRMNFDKKRERKVRRLIKSISKDKLEIITEIRLFEQGVYQIRYLLSQDDIFPEQVEIIEKIIHHIREDEGVVNWHDRLSWLSESISLAKPPGFDEWVKNLRIRSDSIEQND